MLKIIKENNEVLSSGELVRELKKVLTKDELDRHETDLYAKVTPKSKELVNRYEFKTNVTTFKSELDGTLWYDIPFIAGRVNESIDKENKYELAVSNRLDLKDEKTIAYSDNLEELKNKAYSLRDKYNNIYIINLETGSNIFINESYKENQNIKEWYIKTYPTDSLGNELKDTTTFQDLFEVLDSYQDVYGALFKNKMEADSIIRERVFKELANIMDVDYGYIYDQWLKGVRKYEGKKSYKPKKELKEEIDYTNEDYLLTPYWYFTRHGVAPGSIPKNVYVWTSFRADNGHYFATSDVINGKDLKEFEIKEKQPEIESIPEKSRIAIQNYLEKPISKNDELISKRAGKLIEKELGKKPISIKLEKVGSLNTVTALLENKQTVRYILLNNDLYSI